MTSASEKNKFGSTNEKSSHNNMLYINMFEVIDWLECDTPFAPFFFSASELDMRFIISGLDLRIIQPSGSAFSQYVGSIRTQILTPS